MQKAKDWRLGIGVVFGLALRFTIMATLLPLVVAWKIIIAILFWERTDLMLSGYLRAMVSRQV